MSCARCAGPTWTWARNADGQPQHRPRPRPTVPGRTEDRRRATHHRPRHTTTTVLRRHRRRERLLFYDLGTMWRPDGLVFTRPDGRPIRPDWLTHRFTAPVAASGLPRYGARPAARRSHLCHRAVGTGAAGRGVHRPTRPRRFAGSSVGPRGGSLLRAKQEGAIIGVHSVLSWYAVAGVYSATMAALWSRRTRCAPELAPAGVHVVGVHTGYVRHLHGRAHHRPQDGPRGPRAQCLRRHSGG